MNTLNGVVGDASQVRQGPIVIEGRRCGVSGHVYMEAIACGSLGNHADILNSIIRQEHNHQTSGVLAERAAVECCKTLRKRQATKETCVEDVNLETAARTERPPRIHALGCRPTVHHQQHVCFTSSFKCLKKVESGSAKIETRFVFFFSIFLLRLHLRE